MQNTRSASSVIFGRVEQDGGLPGGLLEGLGQVLHHLPGILVEQRVVLHDQEAVVVLFQDGHELVDGEDAAHFSRCNSRWLLRAPASSSTGAMRTLKVSGRRETVGRSSISMIGYGGLRGYEGEARGRGESVYERISQENEA